MAMSKTLTGGHVKVYANGDYIGIVVGSEVTLGTAVRPAHCIDQPHAAELVPTVAQVQATFSVVRLHGTGGVEGAGLSVFPEESIRQAYLTFTFVDRRTDKVVMEIQSALVTHQRWTISSKAIVSGSFGVQGITYTNEAAT